MRNSGTLTDAGKEVNEVYADVSSSEWKAKL
jgi:hypothetical protein